MNRFKLFTLHLFLVWIAPTLVAQQNDNELKFGAFPLQEEIYSFLNREIKFPCANCQFGIAKKPDGYYLTLKNYTGTEISDLNYVKVWDAKSKKYLSPQINAFLDEYSEENKNGLNQMIYEDSRYDFMYVFGYPNWINDLDSILSNKENLTSKEYEMLARSTSEKASDFIHPNQYGSNLNETKNLDNPVYEKTNAYRIEKFIEYAKKSLDYYYQIKKQTPDYQTMIITDLDLKIAHDQMHYYSYLISVKEPEAASYFLNLVDYNEGYLTYARDILDACPTNSILITYGDTDTYPLWYLQDKHGYRKDVIIMNHSLMQTDWYLAMAKELYHYSSELSKTDFTNFYREPFIMEEVDEVMPFNEWINLAKTRYQEITEKRLSSNEEENTGMYLSLPNSCEILIKGIKTPITIQNYYVQMLDIVTLDLIHSNTNRAICTTSPFGFSSLNIYLNFAKRGSVFVLTPSAVEGFHDKETSNYLAKSIEKLNPQTIALMKDVGMYKLLALYDDLLRMDESATKQKALFNQLLQKFPMRSLIAHFSPEVLSSFSEAAAVINPELNKKFKEEYASTALALIQKTDINSPTIKKDVKNLQAIFKLYAEANWRLIPQKTSNFSESEKRVIKALQQKSEELSRSKRCENLIWTTEDIDLLKSALNF